MPETFEFTAPDGVQIAGYRWLPAGKPRAIVQIAHGMAEHAGRYDQFAQALTDAGYAVYANDHRGHGKTAKGSTLGYFAPKHGWRLVVEDLFAVTELAREEQGNLPVVLFGHSMGSLLARTYAMNHGASLAGLILCGNVADTGPIGHVGKAIAGFEGRVRGREHASALMTKLSFGQFNRAFKPARTDFDWLSSDEAEVDAYIADPLCGFDCSDSMYVDLLTGTALVNNSTRAAATPEELPVFIISGEADPCGGKKGSGVKAISSLLRKVGVKNVTLKLYPDARHELLHEAARDEVTGDILHWIDLRLTARGE